MGRAVVVAVVLLVSGLLVGRASLAAFNAQTSNGISTLSAGDVVLTDDSGGSAVFTIPAMWPGDSVTKCVTVTYQGSLPANVRLYGTTGGSGLDAYLDTTVTRGQGGTFAGCAGFTADREDYLGAGSGLAFQARLSEYADDSADALLDAVPGSSEIWTTGETHVYKIQVTLANEAAAQGRQATQLFTFEARSGEAHAVAALRVADSSSGVAIATPETLAAADGVYLTTSNLPTTADPGRYVDFDMPAMVRSTDSYGYPFPSVTFASDGPGTTCVWYELINRPTGVVVTTQGSAGSPVGCATGTTFITPYLAYQYTDVVGTGAAINNLRLRVHATNSAAGGMRVDHVYYEGNGIYEVRWPVKSVTDRADGTDRPSRTIPLQVRGDGNWYQSSVVWPSAFSAGRYLSLKVPATTAANPGPYPPGVLDLTYWASGTTCYYVEAVVDDSGTALPVTYPHGSPASPTCAATTGWVTDQVLLPELSRGWRETDSLRIQLYVRGDSVAVPFRLDQATVTFNH